MGVESELVDLSGRRLPDVIGSGLKVLFCGLNPGLRAVAVGHHFEGRGNRFWTVLHEAGITPHRFSSEDDQSLPQYGCGVTALAARPTAGAGEILFTEFAQGSDGLKAKLRHFRPACIAFLGKAGFLAISGERSVEWGLQPKPMEETLVWVLPNPSGRNLGMSTERLVHAYGEMWKFINAPDACHAG
jgi:TDG/mug DNA glycosylase family protein